MEIFEYFLSAPLADLSAGVFLGAIFFSTALYWLAIRPSRSRERQLTEQLVERDYQGQMLQAQWQHEQAVLTNNLEHLQTEHNRLLERCELLQARASELGESNASLRERLSHYESQAQQMEQAQARLVQLSEEKRDLQTRLEAEREQLNAQTAFLERTKDELKREFELTANKLFERKSEQFNSASQSLLEGTLSPFKSQLQEFRKKVEDVYERENAERNRLSGQIIELQKQAHKIGEDAVSLAQALKGNTKTQGGWGEVVLERLLEQSGLQKGREYETQLSIKAPDGKRRMPDVVVHLPEGKDIIIDAKVSLTDYERYCNSDDEQERQQHIQRHVQSLRAHIKGLSAKDYEDLPGLKALDFVFIFIPIEAAFMLAMQYDTNLYKEAYDRQIILASPTTLLAILRTIDNIWRHEKQNRNAERIARDAGGLHDQFVRLLEALDNVGGHLDKTREAYDLAYKRLSTGKGNLLRRVDTLRTLGAKTKKTIDPKQLESFGDHDTDDEVADEP
ncbi:DNA recombination protein RmuC [Gilvimarinus algae]|uniref:DNA recombination protein RmuC n=1 Tax=Gilvimarinus algae TaxID=3058037 RepID=A0ABT8TF02_9GAMM|nr:DNA recombination protein RmuC [Gilvimarinus sp. SDUM040014]MDO3382521.1 DNA recombination protein RmuC [Gilvimarinus sp. SDUM040014]